MEGSGKVLILEPESTAGFSRTERDVEKIRALWQSGYSVGHRALDDVLCLLDGGNVRFCPGLSPE